MERLLRILFVEDRQNDEKTLFKELELSFKVLIQRVETEGAMQLALDHEAWDLVICDYQTTHVSPYRALELLRASGKDLPFIVISDDVIESVALTIIRAGAHDFIEKSNPPRLALAIRREIILANERMEGRLNTEETIDRTILAWGIALEHRDHDTGGHTQRVSDLTLRLARKMGVTEEKLVDIHRGALLHDVGKMGIRDAILLKPDALEETERAIMQMHPQLAYTMLAPITFLEGALAIPYCHHEHWDGTGYPRRLMGEEIPLEARIFSVIDVYDALTSDRPYRKSWTHEAAFKYIREESGKLFDPNVVSSFLDMFQLDEVKP